MPDTRLFRLCQHALAIENHLEQIQDRLTPERSTQLLIRLRGVYRDILGGMQEMKRASHQSDRPEPRAS